MSLAKRPDYHEWILAFAVMLCEVPKSQRHWLNEFHDVATIGASLVPEAQGRRYAACVVNHSSALRKMRQFDDALAAFQRAINSQRTLHGSTRLVAKRGRSPLCAA
jgi:hypothetical protein